MTLFKLYLGRILSHYMEQLNSGQTLDHEQNFSNLMGEVLNQDDSLGLPGPYIPLFYQIDLASGIDELAKVNYLFSIY